MPVKGRQGLHNIVLTHTIDPLPEGHASRPMYDAPARYAPTMHPAARSRPPGRNTQSVAKWHASVHQTGQNRVRPSQHARRRATAKRISAPTAKRNVCSPNSDPKAAPPKGLRETSPGAGEAEAAEAAEAVAAAISTSVPLWMPTRKLRNTCGGGGEGSEEV